jgi:hypothetical protein
MSISCIVTSHEWMETLQAALRHVQIHKCGQRHEHESVLVLQLLASLTALSRAGTLRALADAVVATVLRKRSIPSPTRLPFIGF